MKTKVEKMPKSTIKLTVTIESAKVKEAYDEVLEDTVENIELDGFRKGKAPKDMVEQKIGVSKLYGEVVNYLLQKYYPQALKENTILAIANPKVEIKEFDLEKDFEFVATIAIKPEVKVGDFRKLLRNSYKDKVEKNDKGEHDHVHMGSNEIIDAIMKETKVEVSDMLIDDEANRMMSRLVDQAQTIGLSLEQYLKSQNKTSDQLRGEYNKIAERNLVAELGLLKIIEDEKVEVSDEEIDQMIQAAGDPKIADRMKSFSERMYIKSILQKNKLISQLAEEIENDKK
ncbi:hypothetical protein A3K34_01460 [candidate division WWE3 bacterium RIFOXYC1_FULL_40_10]|nr:MAG: hypothetical protein A3K58_01460 [candidate division WWE3 bacterium RIFOXYB1_FULL_40_22]OGC61535.1 MAG: hypothetical protein A3K37_01460 [candidate division WWE3 bacterium RIFOXYA1_FULL_40_11]OGC64786.1 MAG: hypothetical protein A2326_01995 [candidate division WWE3 bacterium RIFOXYB2_FULL_41_6]OGC65918.1 MAG: hypothetical protein A3K34_01460 [candidate division WWE3 bacterium RIFOXYC1_FULL_40_10]OGC67068.1 MAG: hypothetical protein A2450_04265 [candidate division WWE3 bacterium RIFOXYC2